jgi:hypothetical protein
VGGGWKFFKRWWFFLGIFKKNNEDSRKLFQGGVIHSKKCFVSFTWFKIPTLDDPL